MRAKKSYLRQVPNRCGTLSVTVQLDLAVGQTALRSHRSRAAKKRALLTLILLPGLVVGGMVLKVNQFVLLSLFRSVPKTFACGAPFVSCCSSLVIGVTLQAVLVYTPELLGRNWFQILVSETRPKYWVEFCSLLG